MFYSNLEILQVFPSMLHYRKQISGTIRQFGESKLICLLVTQVFEGYPQRDAHMKN